MKHLFPIILDRISFVLEEIVEPEDKYDEVEEAVEGLQIFVLAPLSWGETILVLVPCRAGADFEFSCKKSFELWDHLATFL